MRLLLAEDEREYSRALVTILQHSNYAVDAVYNGTDALDYALSGNYDGLIFDIMMPGMDGIQVLRRLREAGVKTPVLMLTAKTQVEDRITGYDAGADDYLPKPFVTAELLARIRALLRRSGSFSPDTLQFENLILDCRTYELKGPKGSVKVTGKEFQMAEMFLRNPHNVFSTEHFMERIWGWEATAEINVVWANVSFLRKKFLTVGADVEIKATRRIGYSLEKKKTPADEKGELS